MLEQILDTYRKAAESTMKLQQEMLRSWTQQGSQTFALPTPGVVGAEEVHTAQKKWTETITDMLNKHRETLDAQYRAGIRTIEDAFRVAEAKDPEQFRKLTEELLRHSFECLKTVAEAQMRDLQAAMQKGIEAASKGATPGKK